MRVVSVIICVWYAEDNYPGHRSTILEKSVR